MLLARVAIAILLLLLPTALHSQAEKRIALLIGNRAYDASVGVLKNPHNDIAAVGEALAKQGFEVLPPIRDARRSAILGGVRELVRKLNTAGSGAIGFLYYSGHGAAEKDTNINYLIPVDAKDPGTTAFWDESLKLDDILRLLDGARSAAKFIVFDACRNELQLPTKDTTKGLVPVLEQQGMFIAYASAPGRTASDRGDKSGPYAAALAAELGRPGLDHLNLFQNVKETVLASTGGAQQPWESNGLARRVYLTGRALSPTANVEVQKLEAERAWKSIENSSDVRDLQAFRLQYGAANPFYDRMAEKRITDLRDKNEEAVAWLFGQSTSVEDLEGVVKQYAGTKIETAIKKRIQELKKEQSLSPPPKLQQPTTTTGMPRCESYSERAACESNVMCSWAANTKCQQKSGGLAIAVLEALPASKPTPEGPCTGVEALVGNEKRCLKPGDSFKDCADCPEMVVVPAGSFTMGSPRNETGRYDGEDQLAVTIAKPFAVGRYAVTRGEFAAFVAATGHKTDGGCYTWSGSEWKRESDKSWRSPGITQNDRHPVVCVSWDDAKAYAAWLSKKTGKAYRLPSEAEREYVARAGTTTPFWWGTTISTSQANYNGNYNNYTYGGGSKGEYRKQTVPVDTFKANPWGLYNVHGNVSEWAEDCRNINNAGNPGDGSARTSGDCSCRAVRGGSWYYNPQVLRSAYRFCKNTDNRINYQGFRLARTLNP